MSKRNPKVELEAMPGPAYDFTTRSGCCTYLGSVRSREGTKNRTADLYWHRALKCGCPADHYAPTPENPVVEFPMAILSDTRKGRRRNLKYYSGAKHKHKLLVKATQLQEAKS